MITVNQVVEEIRSRIKNDFRGLHEDWTDQLLNMVDNVETVADEMNSQGKPNDWITKKNW